MELKGKNKTINKTINSNTAVSKSKVGDCSREQPEGSLFNSYYTGV